MLSTEDLRFFATLAASCSLAAAARALDVTPPAVTQRLQLIERRLGVRLADRSGRRMALTDEGELLAARSRAILGDLDELEQTLSARRGVVSGELRIVAPLGFGRRYVAPVAAAFRTAYPAVGVGLALSDRPGRVPDDAWDLLIQIGDLRDSSLIAQRLAPNARILCASPTYLARRGYPRRPEDLRAHDCIALRENDEDVTLWRFTCASGDGIVSVRIEPHATSNDGEVVRAWAIAGLGVIVRSEWDVAEDLRTGRLVPLLADWHLPAADVFVLLGARHGQSARVVHFLEHLRETLTPPPWRTLRGPQGVI